MVSVILLLLLGFGTVGAIPKYILCDTPQLNVFYILCDESDHPVLTMDPCIYRKNQLFNMSATMIPSGESAARNTAFNLYDLSGNELSKKDILICRTNGRGADLDNVHAKIEIWQDSNKVSDQRYDLCSGVDDEFDFCGSVKGETVDMRVYGKSIGKMSFLKGIYVIKVHLFAGQQEEMFFCMEFTMSIKSNP
ncbi:lymphocyte antigen 96 isoform X1 [Pseudophryne corroboree]|uniref:lymphocyte antigen 96 isoform X1 n=1 Tax=Pseudophryne corroboree TaxID=495146 RepID=UPI0030813288